MVTVKPSRLKPGRISRSVLFACLAFLTAYTATAANAAWIVTLNGSDITSMAMPIDQAGVPLGNVTALSSSLGIQVSTDSQGFWVTDHSGNAWRGSNGDRILMSSTMSMALGAAVDIEGPSVYLPLDTLSTLSGIPIKLSADHAHADFGMAPATKPNTDSRDDGWQDLDIPKTAAELALNSDGQSSHVHHRDNLPLTDDIVHVQTGLGYVQGEDFGLAFNGSGRAYGSGVQFNGLLTEGPRGPGLENAKLMVNDWDHGTRFEAGSLFSELWGTSTGLRVSLLHNSQADGGLSFYAGTTFGQPHAPVLAFDKETTLLRHFTVGGEVGTDGSYLFKQHLLAGPLSIYSYQRVTLHLGTGAGAGVSRQRKAPSAEGVSLQAGSSNDGTGSLRDDYRNLGITFPFIKGTDLTLSRSMTITGSTTSHVNGLSFGMPINGVRFSTAFQWGDTGQELPAFSTLVTREQTLNVSAGWNPSPRAHFDYEVSTRWQNDGGMTQWEQLVSRFQLANSTDLQLISGFPSLLDKNLLRVRLEQSLIKTKSLSLVYGQLIPYEGILSSPSDQGFKLMFNESWSAKTPTHGGELDGRVLDLLGRPVSGAVVRLGSYTLASDAKGHYRFVDVPTGSYQLYIDESSLPANFHQILAKQTITVDSTTRKVVNFTVTPQGTVCGRVYWDKNGDGKYEDGEGIQGAIVRLGTSVTASGPDGTYAFYNIDPGFVSVQLDDQHLPNGYYPVSSTKYQPVLGAGQSLTSLDFTIDYRDKPIVYQDTL